MARAAVVGLLCAWLALPAAARRAGAPHGTAEPSQRELACYARYQETVRALRGPVFNPDYMTPEERARHDRAMRDAAASLQACLAGLQTK